MRYLSLFLAAAALAVPMLEVQAFSVPSAASNNKPSTSATKKTSNSDAFIAQHFSSTECDDMNNPPSLKIILRSLQQLCSQGGSDIRGRFVDHPRLGRLNQASQAIARAKAGVPALTPFAAFCLGHALAQVVTQQQQQQQQSGSNKGEIKIAIGRDPRRHGICLSDAFGRGAQEANPNVRVVYTGIASTPAMYHFCRSGMCDGAVMVTASHLPADRNGFKLFTSQGGFSKLNIFQMGQLAANFAQQWHDREGMLPPTSGGEGVFCSEWVDFLPQYASTLQDAIRREVQEGKTAASDQQQKQPLEGLKIVLNSGNGSGGFFHKVLQELGADVSASVHVEPDPDFPAGIPNPEYARMIEETTSICEQAGADLGIMLDTDADRAGFVVPVPSDNGRVQYEPLNRNRLIALLSVIFSRTSPGCAIVTDSVTSEGLASFIEDKLGLRHIRFLKGYANVIGKAVELTNSGEANAEMAIETSGHCAMKENNYLDDGTYTACKVIGLLAREKQEGSSNGLLSLISDLKEMPEDLELRMPISDESLDTTANVFDLVMLEIEDLCDNGSSSWSLDTENLEGIRVRIGNGGFFMARKSLHDPLISIQVEANSRKEAQEIIIKPLLDRFQSLDQIRKYLDMRVLEEY